MKKNDNLLISPLPVLIFFSLSFSQSCFALVENEHTPIDTVRKDIPVDRKGHPISDYLLDKQKSNQLGLGPIEDGYDSLQIRVWFDYSMAKKKYLAVIKRRAAKWHCLLYTMITKWNDKNDSQIIVSKSVLVIKPSMGWSRFIKQLLDLDVMDMPNGPSGGMDGTTYNVELATTRLYRYYSYWSPETTESESSSKKMVEIIQLLEDVCGFQRSQK